MSTEDFAVAVVGAGVVGSAAALALARRGVAVVLLEAEEAVGLGASGTNSGILHTGFDSERGSLETECILASARLRDPVLQALRIPIDPCGALLARAPADLAGRARQNGVLVVERRDGALEIPGESVTDPVVYTLALAEAAQRHEAVVRLRARVCGLSRGVVHLADGSSVRCGVLVNCAGLYADSVARMAGDDSFSIYPRKGEFLVFDPPAGFALERILLPVPTGRTKGVLVFPTLDGKVVAGPTAVDLDDKDDWSVRPEAFSEIMRAAVGMYPPLEGCEPIAAYAGLRPAGRDGVNYLIGRSSICPWLVNVAAIRSTGLSASLGIAARVVSIVASLDVRLSPEAPLIGGPPPVVAGPPPRIAGPWWQRTAAYRVAA